MKQILQFKYLGIFSLILAAGIANGQRYQSEIFSDDQIQVTHDVTFGTNIRFLPPVDFTSTQAQADLLDLQTTASGSGDYDAAYYDLQDASTTVKIKDLKMDVYEPMQSEDEVENRPVMVYLHTGNFLPPPTNGSPTGLKTDSLAIVACTQWAKRGFVAVSVAYRLGWNPLGDAQERRGTLLNAVYRAIQDTKESVRFLRGDAANENTFAIDPDKIVLFGEGSGGYVALAYATVDDLPAEIEIPKFVDPNTGESYVTPSIVGNEEGLDGALTLYRPNGQSTEISMVINAGGAMGDISWLEAGDAPMVAFHAVRDDFAPFDDGTVIVPTTQENVVDVSGANVFIQAAVDFGNNDAFEMLNNSDDPYTQQAVSLYGTGPYEQSNSQQVTISSTPHGLFPVLFELRPFLTNIASPWQWWDPNSALAQTIVGEVGGNPITAHQASLASNPNMSPEQGRTYLDTINGYAIPRVMCVLELEGNECSTGITETEADNATSIYPNPTKSALTVRNDESVIRRVKLIDITGRVVMEKNVNAHLFQLNRADLNSGVYLMEVIFDSERITKKVMFN